MLRTFTLEYWSDEGWYVGRLREIPGIFSQGESLEELEGNIREAYDLMRDPDAPPPAVGIQTKEIGVEV